MTSTYSPSSPSNLTYCSGDSLTSPSNPDPKVSVESKVNKGLRVQMVRSAHAVLLVLKVQRGLLVLKAQKVIKDQKVRRVRLEIEVTSERHQTMSGRAPSCASRNQMGHGASSLTSRVKKVRLVVARLLSKVAVVMGLELGPQVTTRHTPMTKRLHPIHGPSTTISENIPASPLLIVPGTSVRAT